MSDNNIPKILSSGDIKINPDMLKNIGLKNPSTYQPMNHLPTMPIPEIPKFERQPQEVKLLPEAKTKFEEFIDRHKGAFTFWGFIVSIITLAFVVFSWLNPIR